MAAYRDSADWLRSGVRSGHLICDTREELLALAKQLELPERFYQPQCMLPHYQLPVAFQEAADALGVIFLERAAFTRMAGRIGDRWDAAARPFRPKPVAEQRPARTSAPSKRSSTPESVPVQQNLL